MTSRRRLIRRTLTLIPAAMIALLLCAAAVSAAQVNVTMANFAFDAANITVKVGDTVTWTNKDTAPHNATADDGSFKTPDIATGQSASITFTKAGTFTYICTIHPRMKASVVVQAAGAPGLPSTGGGGMAQQISLPWLAVALLGLLGCGSVAAKFQRRRSA